MKVLLAWKVSKHRVISGPYFPVFGLNAGKYGPEITPYLDTFHAVKVWHYVTKYFVVNQSVNYAELDEFNYVELVYFKFD